MITLSAYRATEEPSRLLRLGRVLVLASQHAGTVPERILTLHGHKGELTATWRAMPCYSEARAIDQAWNRMGEQTVRHVVGGENGHS